MMEKERIFIVAKDAELVCNISSYLKDLNLSVFWEKDRENALRRLFNEEYDLIFLEEGLAGLKGPEVIQQLQSRGLNGCVILMSEEPNVEDVIQALQGGVFDYLVKPFSLERLKQSLKKGLENRRSFMEILALSENLKKINMQLQQKVEELNFLYELSRAIGATLNLEAIEDILSEKLAEIMEYHILGFSHLNDGKVRMRLYSSTSIYDGLKKKVKNETSKRIKDLMGLGISPKKFSVEIRRDNIQRNSGYGSKDFKTWVTDSRSSIHTPLIAAEIPLGMMSIWRMGNNFREDQIRLFQTIANQVAMAFKNAHHHRQAEELAIRDSLTNLLNYRAFHTILEKELNRSQRYQTALSLILIDIDYFKEINDTYGHQEGDRILKEFGELLNKSVRKADMVARYGGEEFAIILPETPIPKALSLSERIRKRIEDHPFFNSDGLKKLTISLGISGTSHTNTMKKDKLIQLADNALYQAKMRGRNQVCVIDPNFSEEEKEGVP